MAGALPTGLALEDALGAALLVLVALGLLAIGGFVVWIGLRYLRTFWWTRHQQAEEVRGTILTARVDERMDVRSDRPETNYQPVVEYEFHYYDGETYTSRNLYPGSETVPPTEGPRSANAIARRYEAGERVTVHVPDDPEAAYLEVPTLRDSLGSTLRYLATVAFGIGLVLLGLLAGREAYLAATGAW